MCHSSNKTIVTRITVMKLVFEHKEDILLIENLIRIPKICVNKSFQTLQYIVSIFDVIVVGL